MKKECGAVCHVKRSIFKLRSTLCMMCVPGISEALGKSPTQAVSCLFNLNLFQVYPLPFHVQIWGRDHHKNQHLQEWQVQPHSQRAPISRCWALLNIWWSQVSREGSTSFWKYNSGRIQNIFQVSKNNARWLRAWEVLQVLLSFI